MKSKTLQVIKELESQVYTGSKLPIFKGCTIINKKGIEKLIDTIYESLPDDVREARKLLKEQNIEIKPIQKDFDNKGIYDYLRDLELQLNSGFMIAKYVVVQIKQIEALLDKISSNLPKEIEQAELLGKNK